jgi:hypothetical protein
MGVDPNDEGLSRRALIITSQEDEWQLEFTNRNGAEVHPWAQRHEWVGYGETRRIRWPRVAVRVLGNDPTRAYWVLLEADDMRISEAAFASGEISETKVEAPPRALTMPQLAAVQAVFADHFAWPPLAQPYERSLEAAGARLQIGASAVRERLLPVQARARRLGLRGDIGITDPTYVFHLVRHGYLSALPPRVDADQRR